MPVPRQIGQVFLARLPVNQVYDEGPHDRTPLLIERIDRPFWFQDAFVISKNGFTGSPKSFRRADRRWPLLLQARTLPPEPASREAATSILRPGGRKELANKKLRRQARNLVSRRRLILGPLNPQRQQDSSGPSRANVNWFTIGAHSFQKSADRRPQLLINRSGTPLG
jgi:hypothetical protein